ncbi:MAG TPA: hypothetical protein VNP03_18655 [Pseudonocardia sp.]|nr:hypothetical protein [Pseudonocardia sp.]
MESRLDLAADNDWCSYQFAGDEFEPVQRSLLEWLFGSWSPDDCADVWLYYV